MCMLREQIIRLISPLQITLLYRNETQIQTFLHQIWIKKSVTWAKNLSPAENIMNSGRNTLVKNFFDRIYRNKFICISRGVNLLSVSTVCSWRINFDPFLSDIPQFSVLCSAKVYTFFWGRL